MSTISTISTHVLDTSLGKPAAGIRVTLLRDATAIGEGVTDADGRVRNLVAAGKLISTGEYHLIFAVGDYFSATARDAFYSEVVVNFRVGPGGGHYHVPLLLSPFGYSTYRGS